MLKSNGLIILTFHKYFLYVIISDENVNMLLFNDSNLISKPVGPVIKFKEGIEILQSFIEFISTGYVILISNCTVVVLSIMLENFSTIMLYL